MKEDIEHTSETIKPHLGNNEKDQLIYIVS
jgi:hypothetical protein